MRGKGRLEASLLLTPDGGELAFALPPSPSLKADGAWTLEALFPEALVFIRASGSGEAGAFLCGSLSSVSLGELMGLLVSGVRTGKLFLVRGGSRRAISFRDGQVIFATSNEPHERLGRILVRTGKLSEARLAEALEKVRPGARLGQVITREGWLNAAQLYEAMADLVRAVVLGAFELEDGHFLFVDGVSPREDALRLPVRTRELLLEGMGCGEDLRRLRLRLPSIHLLVPGNAAPESGAEKAAQERVFGGAPLAVLRPLCAGGELEFLRWVTGLLERSVLAEKGDVHARAEAPAAAGESAEGPLERYAALIRAICQALREAGGDPSALRAFLSSPTKGLEAAFDGVTLSEAGELDVAKVAENVAGPDEARARARAYEALDAFASYALFSAKNALPEARAESLADEYRRISEG